MSESLESERLAALERFAVVDTPSEPLFDSLTELAAQAFNTPIALISLVDQERQWFKARVGLDVDYTARDISFCQHAILSDHVLVIEDAMKDERFRDNPLVVGLPSIRFYAGAPLITPEGHRLGTLCIIDTAAHSFSDAESSRLQALARSVMQALLLRRDSLERARITLVAEQQSKLLTLAENMAGVGTWSWDVASDRTTWSDQVYHIHGYEPGVEPPALHGVLERYHPDDARRLAGHVQRAVAEGLDYALEARIYRPDGSERHVTARGACRKDPSGNVTSIVGTFQDVTEHVTAERFIRAVTNNVPGLVAYWDSELRCRFANAAHREWFDQTPEDMLCIMLPQLLGPALFANIEHHVRAALRGDSQTFHQNIVKPSGEVRHTQTHYIPDIDSAGRTKGFYVFVSDISVIKQAEAKLLESAAQREILINALTSSNAARGHVVLQLAGRETELQRASQRHRQLINGVRDYAIYWLDPTGHVESWNSGAEGMKGYEEAQILGQHYSVFFSAHDRAAGEPERILSTALRQGKCIDEGWRVRKDGSTFWSEVSVEAVYDDGAALLGFAKVSRDVSERKALEQSRKQADAKLQEKTEALRETNRLLLMAEKVSRVGHWQLDVANNSVTWSDIVCAIHGRPSGYKPRLEAAIDAYHPDDRAIVQDHINNAIAMGASFDFEARIIRTDGVTRQVMARGRTEIGPDGAVGAMFGTIQDITEASRQQQALADSEEKYALTLRGMSVGVWDWDIVNNNLSWSAKLLEILGLNEELSPKPEEFFGRLHPEDKKATRKAIQEHLEKRTIYDIEYRLRHARGHYVCLHVMGQAIWSETGVPRRMSGSVTDITDFKRQQQTLIESEETFRRAIENAVVGNVLMAPDGRWLTVNRAFCKLVGFEEADLLRGGTALIQDPREPWNLQETVEALMCGTATVVEGERRLRHCDGHQLWVNVSASLVNRDGGAGDYLVVQFQDLTERKRTEVMKDEFVSTVSHELRTPLTSLFGSLRLLGASTAGKLDPKSQRLLEVAQMSSTQLTGLVNDILDIEKNAAGKMDYKMTTLAAQPLIAEIVDRQHPLADSHRIKFNTRLNVEGLAICVDPDRLNQALLNLLSNAAKYSAAGDQVDIVATREGNAAIRISVTDHGPGIPEAFRSRIFGRFAQADSSTTRKVGGTGLGLNITKTLIEAFGGTVSFDSVEGQGATFHFVLPASELMAPELELEAHD